MPGLQPRITTRISRLLALLSLFTVTPVLAQTELIPFFGYRLSGEFEEISTGSRLDVDDNRNYGLLINIDDKPGSAYEFFYSKQSSVLRSGSIVPTNALFDIDIEYLHLGGILLEPLTPRLHSFFGAGIGITHFSPGLAGYASESNLSLSVTGGIKYTINSHLGLRLDARAYGTSVESSTAVFCNNGACKVRFSGDLFTQLEANAGIIIRF